MNRKHGIRAASTPRKPKAIIRNRRSFFEETHPAGSAEAALYDAAETALAAPAGGALAKGIRPAGATLVRLTARDRVAEIVKRVRREARSRMSKEDLAAIDRIERASRERRTTETLMDMQPLVVPSNVIPAVTGGTVARASEDLNLNDKGGDAPRRSDLSNFLATDEVPETLFGIPVAASPEQYTESDLAFFREHPKAGGFYEMGDEDTEAQAAMGAEGTSEPRRRAPQEPSGDIRELWNRAVKSTGNLDGMARVFAAMSGEGALNQRGATAEQISNGHLARLLAHTNETDRYNGNPHNSSRRTVIDTVNRTSHVLSKHKWGTGPGSNWFDVSKMEPRFSLINADPVASRTARDLIMNVARFLNGGLHGKDWLPSDAVSYGDGPDGLMPDREDIKPAENHIGPMPRGFRIGRKKGK